MGATQLSTRQIGTNGVNRDDLDVSTTTKAVVAKLVAGTNITLGSTGVDAGTGDVTINVSTGLTVPINNISAATATNSINNVNYTQTWNWDSLNNATALYLGSNSTFAASNLQNILKVDMSGANTAGSQTTVAAIFRNVHTGTGAINYAAQFLRGRVSIGTVGTETGILEMNGVTSGTLTIQTAAAAGTWSLTLPTTGGTVNYFLQTNGSGVTTWAAQAAATLTVGSTTIASGTTTRILYNNAGTLGEYTLTGTGTVVAMQTAPTFVTSITSPLVIGGIGTTSTLTYKTTTGVGAAGADHIWVGGNNGTTEFMRILNSGNIGVATITPRNKFEVVGDSIGLYAASAGNFPTNIYLGDGNFNSASYYNQAPGIGSIYEAGTSVTSALGLYIYNASARALAMSINSLGNVGIGTFPGTGIRLDVQAPGNTIILKVATSSVSTGYALGTFTNSGGSTYVGQDRSSGGTFTGSTAYASMFGGSSDTQLIAGGDVKLTVSSTGKTGIGITPTAWLHIKAGTSTAGQAPLKFSTGTNLGTAEIGAFEWDGSRAYITSTGPVRNTIAYLSDIPAPMVGSIDNSNAGDGVTTIFYIAHGLSSTPSVFFAQPGNIWTTTPCFVTADSSYIIITFLISPPTAALALIWNWGAQL